MLISCWTQLVVDSVRFDICDVLMRCCDEYEDEDEDGYGDEEEDKRK